MQRLFKNPVKFETDFEVFERNRMYPRGYRKELAMRKFSISHVSAISRAEYFVIINIEPNMNPFHRKQIEDDLTLLAQIKRAILHDIYAPGLPVTNEGPEETESDGD